MNFKSFIVLSLTLVVGLIGGWFLGFGVTNQELDVDWSAIAGFASALTTLLGSLIVLWIFFQWKHQKNRELLANKALEISNELLRVVTIAYSIKNGKYDVSEHKAYINEFNNLFEKLAVSIIYLDGFVDIKDMRPTYETMKIACNNWLYHFKNENVDYRSNKLFNEEVKKFGKNAIYLSAILTQYVVYKKTPELKL